MSLAVLWHAFEHWLKRIDWRFESKDVFELETASGFRLWLCSDCGFEFRRLKLSGSEICARLGHDRSEYRDQITNAIRNEHTGELVRLVLVRQFTCKRCGDRFRGSVPPETIPDDLFEKIDNALANEKEAEALDRINLKLGKGNNGEI